EGAKDGVVTARVQFLEAVGLTAVGQRQRRPDVAGAVAEEEGLQGLAAQLQSDVPERALDFVQRPAIVAGCLEQVQDLGNEVFEEFLLENGQRFCDAHGRASVRVTVHQLQNYPPEALLSTRPKATTCREHNSYAQADERL